MSDQKRGYFGMYGGQHVPEVLIPALDEVDEMYQKLIKDPTFHEEFAYYLKHYTGRPSSLYRADRLTAELGGATIYLKKISTTRAHTKSTTRSVRFYWQNNG